MYDIKGIPKNAKLVFKGKIFKVYQWRQRLYDGSYKTYEMITRPNIVGVIAVVGRKIAVTDQIQPGMQHRTIEIPGGRPEKDENPLNTAKRELLEEAGLKSKNWRLFKVKRMRGKVHWSIYTYIAKDCKKDSGQNLDAGEKIDVKLISFDRFLKLASKTIDSISVDCTEMRYNKTKRDAFYGLLFGKVGK